MNKDRTIKNNGKSGTQHEFAKLEDTKLNKEFSHSYSLNRTGEEGIKLVFSKRVNDSSSKDALFEINIQLETLQNFIDASKQALELFSDVFGTDESLIKFDKFSSGFRLLYDDEKK